MAEIDKHSATWKHLEGLMLDRRAAAVRDLIAGHGHDDETRGRIRELDELLELGSDSPQVVTGISY